jgi:hypothetical protein
MRVSRPAPSTAGAVPALGSSPGAVDAAAVGRGAWRGFAVLLLGGVLTPGVFAAQPAVGQVWPTMVAVAAFVFAAWRPAGSGNPRLYGLFAACGAYMLILPLQTAQSGATSLAQVATTFFLASAVGAITGVVRRSSGEVRRP